MTPGEKVLKALQNKKILLFDFTNPVEFKCVEESEFISTIENITGVNVMLRALNYLYENAKVKNDEGSIRFIESVLETYDEKFEK